MTSSRLVSCFSELGRLVEGKQRFCLSGHAGLDGDSLGAMAAFYFHLCDLGREAMAFVHEPLSRRYHYLDLASVVTLFDVERHADVIQKTDVFIAFDLSSPARLGGAEKSVATTAATVVYVDHHPQDGPPPGDLNIIDETACATGMLVYDYLRYQDAPLSPRIARALVTALVTDTGWFRYANTSRDTFRVMNELLAYEVDLGGIYRAIYQSNDVALLRLVGAVTSALRSESSGRLLWSAIPLERSRELGLEADYDTDVILDLLRSGAGVEAIALFREVTPGTVRVNLRSRGGVNVNRVARRFGGGGHRNASGLTYAGDLAGDAGRIVEALKRELASSAPNS